MRLFESPMLVTSLCGLCLLAGLDAPPAYADFTFGERVNLGPVVNSPYGDYDPYIAPDGLSLYFASTRPGGVGLTREDIYVTTRATVSDPWGPPVNLGEPVNSGYGESCPFITADGLTFVFSSDRPGGLGGWDIWVSTRQTKDADWGPPENLGAAVNSGMNDYCGCISPDGCSLYLSNCDGAQPVKIMSGNIYVTTRPTSNSPWGERRCLGLLPWYANWDPRLSPEGRVLFFDSDYVDWTHIWLTTRTSTDGNWGTPVMLGPEINKGGEAAPSISADGSTLYFCAGPRGWTDSKMAQYDLWQATISPIVDFNGDGKVDATEMAVLVANWGKNQPLCDIGPFPWGDGTVDTEDLRILMKHATGSDPVTNPLPHASEVPLEVILSWMSPPFAQSYDVYVGTSFADVNSADRANPRGVLVSRGQTATTYDPESLLEYGRTCYWRVDFVSAGPAFTVYKGSVWDFKTEAYPIKNVTATASSSQAGWGPENTVNGSGLDMNDGHSTTSGHMWLSAANGPKPAWIQYEFDKVYPLHELWVWNHNLLAERTLGLGAKTVKIEYSTDGTTWTLLDGVPEFARAPGQLGYAANTTVSFGGVSAKFVKLTILANWGGTPMTGLSEVRFFCIQTVSVPKP
jgi:hypothetical protein